MSENLKIQQHDPTAKHFDHDRDDAVQATDAWLDQYKQVCEIAGPFPGDTVVAKVRAMKAIVDRLPKTADGVHITGPDMEVWVWGWPEGSLVKTHVRNARTFDDCWSTESAACAAAGKGVGR